MLRQRTTPWLEHYDLHAYLRYNGQHPCPSRRTCGVLCGRAAPAQAGCGRAHLELAAASLDSSARLAVYLRKPARDEMAARRRYSTAGPAAAAHSWHPGGATCRAFRSSSFRQRYTRDGRSCVVPFRYKGVAFDDCWSVLVRLSRPRVPGIASPASALRAPRIRGRHWAKAGAPQVC